MGFSLKAFFEDLQAILGNEDLGMLEKLEQLQSAIEDGQKYADECGQLR